MALRRPSIYLAATAGLALSLGGIFLHASRKVRVSLPDFTRKIALVRQLELTDLCLVTESSYTRHLSMTDPSALFQDATMSLELWAAELLKNGRLREEPEKGNPERETSINFTGQPKKKRP